ncbi:Dolichyl-diphosphooligosaccharide-protein glycosyltransferase subunit dad1 [Physocladia obscura]|uniref:Dolichyl-diphosphooligosaccharide--protein glycosyltransferase subunit OST2 n=1 Tax=Physocladia obscura TaxID=109957 RepID=A0AAD5T8G4_9FUNG|nr:Dolichyl-diphosphooligosaccharide-protein glycosyltransferase subunit dad1 [Physocladia obscura]
MAKNKTEQATKAAGASATATTSKDLNAKTKAIANKSFVSNQISLVTQLVNTYTTTTPQLLRLIDAYLAAVMVSGIIQFVYVVVVGTFPYNSFLSGFAASVGAFVLAANLRMQLNPKNDFYSLTPEGAFAEFVFCSLVFYGFVVNFLG